MIIGNGTIIGSEAFVDHSVVIGSNVRIQTGAAICSLSEIGDNTIIRESTVIRGAGLGFELSIDGIPIRLPHLGGIQIARNVETGVFTAVRAGTMDPTVVEDDVKVGDSDHIVP